MQTCKKKNIEGVGPLITDHPPTSFTTLSSSISGSEQAPGIEFHPRDKYDKIDSSFLGLLGAIKR